MTSQQILEAVLAKMAPHPLDNKDNPKPSSLMQTAGQRTLDGEGLTVYVGLKQVLDELENKEQDKEPAKQSKKTKKGADDTET